MSEDGTVHSVAICWGILFGMVVGKGESGDGVTGWGRYA